MIYEIGKRIIDILGAVVGIILFSPILLAAAIWVKCVSPEGPVFADIKDRVGRNRKPFKLLKFRSMVPNGYDYLKKHFPDLHKKYEENNYKLDADEDPRIIKGGKFMRKFSIDELPQFFNVLYGDMSLVGPRAYYFYEIDEQLARYPETRENLETALSVKPGITGLWQISGRSKVGFVDRVKMDATYAQKKSLMYDLMIILKTPYVVITSKGAY
jgi:lipopolysaccharide/colanic/teichoic acid biosynthesis glycosyltransferase